MTQLALLVLAVAQPVAAPAAAAPASAAAPAAAAPAAAASASAAAPAAADPAWQLYQQGVAALGAGRPAEARRVFVQVLAHHPGHPAAVASAGLLGSLGPAAAPAPPPAAVASPATSAPAAVKQAPPRPARVDLPSHVKKSGAGRTLLIGVQTAHGLVVGAEVCLIADCSNFRVIGPVLAAGTLGGLIGSIKYSEDGISSGRAASIDTGTAFGFAHAGLLVYSFEMNRQGSVGTTLLAGQLIGTAAGAHFWDVLGKPSIDDMAFSVISAAGAMYLAGAWLFNEEGRNADIGALGRGLSAMAVADGAALTAWILRKETPMPWGRGGVILASAAAGAFGGLGVEALIEGEETTPAFLVLFMAAGAYTGAITAAWTTRDFDRSWGEDSPRATLASRDSGVVPVPVVIPTDGGGLGGFAFTW